MTIKYCILDQKSSDFEKYQEYYYNPTPIENIEFQIIFLNVGFHDIDIDYFFSPQKIINIFSHFLIEKFKVIKVEIYGLSFNTEYFTHFIEYSIPTDSDYSLKLVYYLNKDDKSIFKYDILIVNQYTHSENTTIYSQDFKVENGIKVHYAYVSYNFFELGFAVAQKKEIIFEPICKFCYYKTNSNFLRCTIHPSLNHKELSECRDFVSIKKYDNQ